MGWGKCNKRVWLGLLGVCLIPGIGMAEAADHAAAPSAASVDSHASQGSPRIEFFSQDRQGPRYPVAQLYPGKPLYIRLANLEPNSQVTLVAEWKGCSARAVFKADAIGDIDLSEQAPLQGSYRGRHSQGMLWSMVCPDQAKIPKSDAIVFTASAAGKPIATATVERQDTAPGVTVRDIQQDGVVGKIYLPNGKGPFPTVVVIGGSEGGIRSAQGRAAYLASRGYAALALGYFGMKGLPPELKKIPLETFGRAIDWIAKQPELKSDHLGLWGLSRGGELALLAATKYPQFGAVVAAVPSSVVWPGLSADERDPVAWTWRGKPVPQVAGSDDEFSDIPTRPLPGGKSKAAIFTPTFEAQMKDAKEVARTAIPVEKIKGPVLLLGGEADDLWPSAKFTRMAWDRLHAAKHPYPDQMANFPDAGHGLCGLPGHPTTFEFAKDDGSWMSFGGTAAGNAAAQTQALQDIDKFLDKNLATPATLVN